MRYVKQLSVALMALGLSSPILANANNSVTIPSQNGGFKVGIDSLYLRNNAVTNASDTSYDIGFSGELGYLFASTGNDLTVAYNYIRADNNDSMDIDTVDLEAGQRLVSGPLDMRFFGGLRYTHLDYDMNTPEKSLESKFHGIGPRFGADIHYNITNEFGLATHVSTALLAGTLSSQYQDEKVRVSNSTDGIVPHTSAKLGVDYTYAMQNSTKSLMVFEVGYQANHDFKVIANQLDASFNGPYIDVKYYA